MNKLLIHIGTGLIPNKQLRRRIREKLLSKNATSQCAKGRLCCNSGDESNDSVLSKECMPYYSCNRIENLGLIFWNSSLDASGKSLAFCCEPIENVPGVAFCKTAEESIHALIREREEVISESKRFSLRGEQDSGAERKYTSGCTKCVHFQLKDWKGGTTIFYYVNFSMYPAPCQCKCIYCDVRKWAKGLDHKQLKTANYEKILDLVEWANENGMIDTNAAWQISSGEITIHPYKERILNLVKGKKAKFCSNCFIFDEKIGANLAENPDSTIELSIDSGTPETWYKVKGVDNFNTVIENLRKYHASTTRTDQICLKYIVLPGINDNDVDYMSVIEIMNRLDVGRLYISRDVGLAYADEDKRNILIEATGRLVAMLHSTGKDTVMWNFSSTEQDRINAFANEVV